MATTSQPSKNRNYILLGALLFLVGVIAVYQFLAPRLTEAKAKLEVTRAQLKGIETDVKILTTAQNQLQQAEQVMATERGVDFEKVPLVYPRTEDVPGLYLQLEALMAQALGTGITLPAYQVSPPVMNATDNRAEIPVAVSAVGSYPQLQLFMSRLEQNLRPLTIQTVNLSQTLDKDKGVPNGQFTLNIAGVVRAEALSAAYGNAAGSN